MLSTAGLPPGSPGLELGQLGAWGAGCRSLKGTGDTGGQDQECGLGTMTSEHSGGFHAD